MTPATALPPSLRISGRGEIHLLEAVHVAPPELPADASESEAVGRGYENSARESSRKKGGANLAKACSL